MTKHKDNTRHEHDKKQDITAPAAENKTSAVPPSTEPAPQPPADTTGKELENRMLRLQADFDNFRKRVMRERSEIYKRANEELMAELLNVLDHLQMALEAAVTHDAPKAFVEGFQSVSDQLSGALTKFGLEPVDATGKQFDPNEQEAVSHIPSDAVPENAVITQTRRGYRLAGRLLRPAQVVVSSGKPADAVPETVESKKV